MNGSTREVKEPPQTFGIREREADVASPPRRCEHIRDESQDHPIGEPADRSQKAMALFYPQGKLPGPSIH